MLQFPISFITSFLSLFTIFLHLSISCVHFPIIIASDGISFSCLWIILVFENEQLSPHRIVIMLTCNKRTNPTVTTNSDYYQQLVWTSLTVVSKPSSLLHGSLQVHTRGIIGRRKFVVIDFEIVIVFFRMLLVTTIGWWGNLSHIYLIKFVSVLRPHFNLQKKPMI